MRGSPCSTLVIYYNFAADHLRKAQRSHTKKTVPIISENIQLALNYLRSTGNGSEVRTMLCAVKPQLPHGLGNSCVFEEGGGLQDEQRGRASVPHLQGEHGLVEPQKLYKKVNRSHPVVDQS